MPGDWFIDMFTSELDKLLSELKRGDERLSAEIPRDFWWVPRLPPPARDPRVAAVDGGSGAEPLVGGSAFYVARAMAVFNPPGDPVKLIDVKLLPLRDSRVLDSLRAIVEQRAALRALERLPAGEEETVLLMDGSYRALVSAAVTAIKRAAYGYVNLSALYAGLFSLELLVVAARLFRSAVEKGVAIAYVSKDSGYRSFKEAVLLKLLEEAAEREGLEELAELAAKAARIYPLKTLRERLLTWRKRVPPRIRPILDMILDIGYRDVLFIDDYTGGAVGHTVVLEVGLGGLYGGDIGAAVDRMCRRIEEYLGGFEAENCRGLAPDAVQAYQMLPATRMMYVRLGYRDTLLLVETPGYNTIASDQRRLDTVGELDERVLRVLVAGYAGPRFYNRWLVAAHEAATLRGEQLVLYAKIFDALAQTRGVKLRLARRTGVGVTGIA